MVDYSIIIPHYNIPDLLDRLLSSIPIRNDVEVIVVDDKSSEIVFRQLELLRQRYCFSLFSNDGKKGAGTCRNRGLAEASGRWVVFADADDFFCDDFSVILDAYKDDSADLVYFNIDSVLSENISVHSFRSRDKQNLFNEYNKNPVEGMKRFRYGYPEPWGKFIKRALIEQNKISFDETPVCNDFKFSFMIGVFARIVKIDNRQMYVLTLRSGSISNNYGGALEKIVVRFDVLCRVQQLARDNMVQEKYLPVQKGELLYLILRFFPKQYIKELNYFSSQYKISKIKLIWLTFSMSVKKIVGRIYGCFGYNC